MNRENIILAVFGRKGQGKTYLVRQIAQEWDRVVVIDTTGEYKEEDGYTVVYGVIECAHALVAADKQDRVRLSLRTDNTDEAIDLLVIINAMSDLLVIVEEAHFYCSPSQLPDAVSKLVRLGRHRNLSSIWVAQRPAAVNRNVTSQADLIISFAQREPRDIAYLVQVGGQEGLAVQHLATYRRGGPPAPIVVIGDDLSKAPLVVLERMRRPRRSAQQLDAFDPRE
jgi:DNA helicase HerA-like ATPase